MLKGSCFFQFRAGGGGGGGFTYAFTCTLPLISKKKILLISWLFSQDKNTFGK